MNTVGVCQWNGAFKASSNSLTLSDTIILNAPLPINQTFALRTVAGSQANFAGFNQFRLFCPYGNFGSGLLVATADLPDRPKPDPPSPSPSNPPPSSNAGHAVHDALYFFLKLGISVLILM